MERIDRLRQRLSSTTGITQLSQDEVEQLKAMFPGLPGEYVQFLVEVGFGDLGELQLYSRLASARSIYPQPKDDLSAVFLFGDDFQGYSFGFDTQREFALVEVDPRGSVRLKKEDGFLSLLESYMLE